MILNFTFQIDSCSIVVLFRIISHTKDNEPVKTSIACIDSYFWVSTLVLTSRPSIAFAFQNGFELTVDGLCQ